MRSTKKYLPTVSVLFSIIRTNISHISILIHNFSMGLHSCSQPSSSPPPSINDFDFSSSTPINPEVAEDEYNGIPRRCICGGDICVDVSKFGRDMYRRFYKCMRVKVFSYTFICKSFYIRSPLE